MRTILLVRHGDYQLDEIQKLERNLTLEQHYELHAKEGGLTPTGIKQAKLTAERLKPLPIDAIHCSSLRRTSETAKLIAKEFPKIQIQKSSLLWECVPSIPKDFAQHEHFRYISETDVGQWKRQADEAFERYFKSARRTDRREIIVSHANLIRYLVCRALHVQVDAWFNMCIDNCGISEIRIDPDHRMRLVSYNDVGHLPPQSRTGSWLTIDSRMGVAPI
jgi:broad specificity phosphatase PhoE